MRISISLFATMIVASIALAAGRVTADQIAGTWEFPTSDWDIDQISFNQQGWFTHRASSEGKWVAIGTGSWKCQNDYVLVTYTTQQGKKVAKPKTLRVEFHKGRTSDDDSLSFTRDFSCVRGYVAAEQRLINQLRKRDYATKGFSVTYLESSNAFVANLYPSNPESAKEITTIKQRVRSYFAAQDVKPVRPVSYYVAGRGGP